MVDILYMYSAILVSYKWEMTGINNLMTLAMHEAKTAKISNFLTLRSVIHILDHGLLGIKIFGRILKRWLIS